MQNRLISPLTKVYAFLLAMVWRSLLLSQNCAPVPAAIEPGECPSANIDIAYIVDEAFIADFGGDVDLARGYVLDIHQLMDDNLGNLLSNHGYEVSFHKAHFTDFIAPNYWNTGDTETWASYVRGYFGTSAKRCIRDKVDILVLLTGQDFGEDGFQATFGDVICEQVFVTAKPVAVVQNQGDSEKTARVLAHEMMHAFGIGHTNSPPTQCAGQCNQDPIPLMCEYGGTYYLTGCDLVCLPKFFDGGACDCLNAPLVSFPDDYTCPPPDEIQIIASVESNPNPVQGCFTGGDEVIVTVTLINGTPAANRNIRAYINNDNSDFAEFVIDPALDFNCIKEFANRIELRRIDVNTTDCEEDDSDISDPYGVDESKVFRFKVRYKGGLFPASGTGSLNSFKISIYTGNDVSTLIKETHHFITPFIEINGGNFSTLLANNQWDNNNPLFIKGDLVMDDVNPPADYVYHFGTNKKLLFAPGISLDIANTMTTMIGVDVGGCDNMWKGIEVRSGSALSIDNMSTIRDANIAVSAQKGAFVKALNTKFLNNNFAVTTAPSGTGNYNITLLSNQYGTTVGGLKPAYSGQSPAPLEKGFAGVYANDITNGLVIDSDPSSGEPNHFFNLKYGIISKNTNMTVFDSRFDDITKVTKGTGYDGYVNAFVQTGKGVYASEGYILVAKEGTKDVIFSNCHTGVETLGSSSQVGSTTMDGVTNGIITTGGTALHLSNTIKAKSRGISTLLSSGPGSGSVGGNIITMNEDPNGIGISIGGGVSGNTNIGTSPPSDDYYTFNTITMLDGAAAISAGINDNGTFANNTINLNNSQTNRFGIHIEGGDRNTLKCNAITGVAGDNTGIYAIHASRALVHCNLTESTDEGLRFEGVLVGKAKADIAGNTMKDNGTGLLYGIDAITGTQEHRGNKWEGSFGSAGAVHQGIIDVALFSEYTVDEFENPDFFPGTLLPLSWFQDIYNEAESYQCSNENGNCITAPPVIYEQPLDIKIVRGELPGTEYQAAVNWLAQRRFYERLLEEGNPYPGNSDVATFLTAAQSNGLAAYANLQTGIRQLFAVSTTDRNTFQSYEENIAEGLEDLAAVEQELNAPGISQQDSAGFAAQRDTLRQMIQQAATAKGTLLNNIATSRASAAASLLTQNGNLPALSPVYTVHEKTVNDILLRTVAQGIYTFAEGNYNTLRTIANLCPLSDGEAVLRARALLTLVNENPLTYDDETICSTERGRPGLAEKPDYLRIFPNPANNQATVEYKVTNASGSLFLLYNASGQLVKTVILSENQDNIQLSLSGLPEGIYWYSIPGLNTPIFSGKFIINH